MKSSEKRKFEKEWTSAFADAEMNPSEAVWTKLDLQLSRQENGDMRRRVVLYQRMIAASIVIALLLGGGSVLYWKDRTSSDSSATELTELKTGTLESVGKAPLASQTEENNSTALSRSTDKVDIPNKIKSIDGKVGGIARRAQVPLSPGFHLLVTTTDNPNKSNNSSLDNGRNTLVNSRYRTLDQWIEEEPKLSGKPRQEISSPTLLPRSAFVKIETKKSQNESNDWIASIGGSAGGYSSGANSANDAPARAVFDPLGAGANADPVSKRESVGNSYSVGMTFGKKIAPRWMVMSGFNYLNQSIGYNSNVTVADAGNQSKAFLADLSTELANVSTTTPYALNSVNEFFSVPVQVGYLVINRKFGFQLDAGVAADFFVKNTLADESGRLSTYSEGPGSNSSYRSVNWAGLFGTEFNYKVNKHYRISLVPGLRYSFTSVLKQSTGSTLNPFVWDIGFRFGYIF